MLTLALYVNPGDEILLPDPGYPGYRHMVRAFEGAARALKVTPATNFQPTLEMVRAAWGPRTRGLLLGSPSNPTGTIISNTELEKIARFVAQRGGVLIVDEIYQGLVYGEPASTALGLPGEVVLVNSFSKYFCMTGWRLGWVMLPDAPKNARMREFEKLAQHLFICAPSVAQHAALACFLPSTLKILERRRIEFQRRRDFLIPAIERAGLAIPARPTGAFYIYAACPGRNADAKKFALQLLESEGVAATPGIDFGTNATRGYVRFAYTRSMPDLQAAAARVKRFCEKKIRPRSGEPA